MRTIRLQREDFDAGAEQARLARSILDGLEDWCRKRGFPRVADLTGAMIDEAPMETFAAAAAPIG